MKLSSCLVSAVKSYRAVADSAGGGLSSLFFFPLLLFVGGSVGLEGFRGLEGF